MGVNWSLWGLGFRANSGETLASRVPEAGHQLENELLAKRGSYTKESEGIMVDILVFRLLYPLNPKPEALNYSTYVLGTSAARNFTCVQGLCPHQDGGSLFAFAAATLGGGGGGYES